MKQFGQHRGVTKILKRQDATKPEKDGNGTVKTPTEPAIVKTNLTAVRPNLTAVKLSLTAVKTNLTAVKPNWSWAPTKYKFLKVRTSETHKGHKGHKVQIPAKYKVQMPCHRHVTYRMRNSTKHKDGKSEPPGICCKGRLPHRNKHTPYGPYNIHHMVLCTKQGPDNA